MPDDRISDLGDDLRTISEWAKPESTIDRMTFAGNRPVVRQHRARTLVAAAAIVVVAAGALVFAATNQRHREAVPSFTTTADGSSPDTALTGIGTTVAAGSDITAAGSSSVPTPQCTLEAINPVVHAAVGDGQVVLTACQFGAASALLFGNATCPTVDYCGLPTSTAFLTTRDGQWELVASGTSIGCSGTRDGVVAQPAALDQVCADLARLQPPLPPLHADTCTGTPRSPGPVRSDAGIRLISDDGRTAVGIGANLGAPLSAPLRGTFDIADSGAQVALVHGTNIAQLGCTDAPSDYSVDTYVPAVGGSITIDIQVIDPSKPFECGNVRAVFTTSGVVFQHLTMPDGRYVSDDVGCLLGG